MSEQRIKGLIYLDPHPLWSRATNKRTIWKNILFSWREFNRGALRFIFKGLAPSSSGQWTHRIRAVHKHNLDRNESSSYLSSCVRSSGSPVGVREGGTGSGAARTRGTTGCARSCWAWASGSNRRRRRPLQSAASRWCPPRPRVHNPPPPPPGPPSRHCTHTHKESTVRSAHLLLGGGTRVALVAIDSFLAPEKATPIILRNYIFKQWKS